jgi:hypothetical protein
MVTRRYQCFSALLRDEPPQAVSLRRVPQRPFQCFCAPHSPHHQTGDYEDGQGSEVGGVDH